MDTEKLEFGAHEIAQMQRFNKTLAWLPRFRIRNRVTPRLIQALLRVSQKAGTDKLRKHSLEAENIEIDAHGVRVPLRIIRPKGKARGVVLDFHGGGWVIGNPQMNDELNAGMVNACNVAVVSVDYRLAVNTPVEGLLQDCLGATRWLLGCNEFADLPVIVVGESAGGHLAAATLLGLQASPEFLQRIHGALLYYGVYDLTGSASVRAATADTLLLDGPGMVEALRQLTPDLNDAQRQQPPLSPLYGDFAGMPPALMFVGELDPLRDDTLELAARWKASAAVEVHLLPACAHGFIHFPMAMADKVLAHSRTWINLRLGARESTGERCAQLTPATR
ncbi:alpha/beta hydrolase [Pseudomonas sp. H1h]|uniref:alpha/beta hydrolase n=1 Tax=Pseudomonas sp. H1h TaxID=1397280 RepID=UPI00046914B3|nr:alpha/beta hydrolase [Pseudomonas sp. H1h]